MMIGCMAYGSEPGYTGTDPYSLQLSDQYTMARQAFQDRQWGQAMLHLKRAHSISPLDQDIIQGMNSIRQELNIPPVFYYQEPLASIVARIFLFIPLSLLSMTGLLILITGSILWSLDLLKVFKNIPPALKKIGLGLFLGSVFILSVSLGRQIIYFGQSQAVVMETASLLTRPDEQDSMEMELLPGLECQVLEEKQDYFLIKSIDGKQGWVLKKKVSQVWPTSKA